MSSSRRDGPRWSTDRLRIAPIAADDVVAFVAYRRNANVSRLLSWPSDYSIDDALALAREQASASFPPAPGGWLRLGLRDVDSGQLAGDVAVHTLADAPETYELAVTLSSLGQGRGFATEAMELMLDVLFRELGARRVVARCDARNERGRRLLTRLGMHRGAVAIDPSAAGPVTGEQARIETWALLADEWRTGAG